MLHLFCFLYHFQGIQPESGQKNEKSGITDSRTSQHLRADRMSGKEMKMPAKRQQPPLLHHSPKNGNSCHEKPNVNKKPCGKTWHILYRKESSKNKRQHSVRFPTRENPLFATAPVPACKYAILVSQKMTICHFGSYATNCPQARVPPRLSLAWIRGGRNAHGGHAGKCSRRGCCAAHRTSGLP